MLRKLKTHLNPATVLAAAALFVALGGVSYAAVKIDGKDIKNKSIAGKKLKNGAVTNAKVKKATLKADRLTPGARAALKGNTGPQGPAGPQGPQGPAGLSAIERIEVEIPTSMSTNQSGTASCPPGKKAIGGGGRVFSAEGLAFLDESIPSGDSAWYAEARTVNSEFRNFGLRIWVICAQVS